jgi:hypothetical protein
MPKVVVDDFYADGSTDYRLMSGGSNYGGCTFSRRPSVYEHDMWAHAVIERGKSW